MTSTSLTCSKVATILTRRQTRAEMPVQKKITTVCWKTIVAMRAKELLPIKVTNWALIRLFHQSTSRNSCQDAHEIICDRMQRHQQAGPNPENLHSDVKAHLINLNRRLQLASQLIALEVRWQDTIKVVQLQIAYLPTLSAKTLLRLKHSLISQDSKWLADPNTPSYINRINKSNSNKWEVKARRPSTRV